MHCAFARFRDVPFPRIIETGKAGSLQATQTRTLLRLKNNRKSTRETMENDRKAHRAVNAMGVEQNSALLFESARTDPRFVDQFVCRILSMILIITDFLSHSRWNYSVVHSWSNAKRQLLTDIMK